MFHLLHWLGLYVTLYAYIMRIKRRVEMGNFITFILTLIISLNVFSLSPLAPEVASKFGKIEKENIDGKSNKHLLRFTLDATSGKAVGTHGLKQFLPKNAVVTNSYGYFKRQLYSSSSSTLAFQCEDADNILTAGDFRYISSDSLQQFNSSGSSASMVKSISSPCEIKAVIGTTALTDGYIKGFIEYVSHE